MHRDLLRTTPLLALPIFALFAFLGVFVLATVRAMTRNKAEVEAAARLPLEENPHVRR